MNTEPVYEVVAPTGLVPQDHVPINLYPTSLSEQTIGFVWDYLFKGPVVFDAIRDLIYARFTGSGTSIMSTSGIFTGSTRPG